MSHSHLITDQLLIPLFLTTYQGSSTQEINAVYQSLLQISKAHSNSFLNACENIMQNPSNPKSLRRSVSNFIKVLTKIMIDENLIDHLGPKDYINKVEHIFDNLKIPFYFKQDIAVSYIKAALHFRVNFERVVQRVIYLYKTKEGNLGVLLSRAYIACDKCLDSKLQGLYYKKILPLQFKYLTVEIIKYNTLISESSQQNKSQSQKSQQIKSNIYEVLKNIHSSLAFIAFQKFQTSIYACLQCKQIIEIGSFMKKLIRNKKIIVLLRELFAKIVQNLYRMRRLQKFESLIKVIAENMHAEWQNYQQTLLREECWIFSHIQAVQQNQDIQEEISMIRFLTIGFQSNIMRTLDDHKDVLSLFIRPLYFVKERVFNQQTIKQAFLLLEDVCFTAKSECLEVQFNKLVKTIFINYPSVSSKIVSSLNQFLFNNQNFEAFVQNQSDKVIVLLNLVALQVSYFMTIEAFNQKLQIFLKRYARLLFGNQNIEVYVHSLLVLFHYLDDIFCQEQNSQIFRLITQRFITNRFSEHKKNKKMLTVSELEKKILRQFFSAGYSEKQVQEEVNFSVTQSQSIILYLSQNFDGEVILIFTEIIKKYQIEDKVTLDVLDRMLQSINSQILNKKAEIAEMNVTFYPFVKFLEAFFGVQSYKHLFESTLSRILPIFEVVIDSEGLFQEELFCLIKNAVQHLQYVPENYFSWMSNLFNYSKLQSEESFKALAVVLQFSPPSNHSKNHTFEIFVNCIASNIIQILASCFGIQGEQSNNIGFQDGFINEGPKQKNGSESSYFDNKNLINYNKKELMAILCLHHLIHYHSSYLTRKILALMIQFVASKITIKTEQKNKKLSNRESLNFIMGKYQLVFILLFKGRLIDVNQILSKLQIQNKVYDAVYQKDNQYLLQYDASILIKEQSEILKNFMKIDTFQMKYANTSFLIIFYKFYLLYEAKNNKKGKFSYVQSDSQDSDEEEFESQSFLKNQFKQMIKLVRSFPKPKRWQKANELKEMKDLIQWLISSQSSREWLDVIAEKCLNKQQKKLLRELMGDLQVINGKYRHIFRINKGILKSDWQAFQKQETND